ncbi:TolC family protein [Thermosulfuriphilus sp.]
MPFLKIRTLGLFILTFFFPAMAISAPAQETVEFLVQRALEANLEIESLKAQLKALEAKTRAVQVWMDPVLSIEYSNVPHDSLSLGESAMSGIQFKLAQRIPFPGKNEKRRLKAEAEYRVKRWELEEAKVRLQGLIKKGYYQLYLIRELGKLTEEHIGLVEELLSAVKARYEAGAARQFYLLRLESLRDRLQDDLLDFEQKDRELTAVLNAAVHRQPTVPIPTPEIIHASAPSLRLEELISLALDQRPLLKREREYAQAQRLAAEAAAWERWPDVTLWAGYRYRRPAGVDPGTDFISLGISIPLPFDYKGRFEARRQQFLAEARAAEARYRRLVDEIGARLEAALSAWERAAKKAEFYQKGLVPKARETLTATLSAYQTGKADFESLFKAELELLDFERTVLRATAETAIQRAEIEALIGQQLQ